MPAQVIKALCLSICVLLAQAAGAQVYKCVGANGKIGFSDKPCPSNEKSSTVKLRKSARQPTAAQSPDGLELAEGWTPGGIRDFTDYCTTTHLGRARPQIDAAARASGKSVDEAALREQYAGACDCAGRSIASRFSYTQYQGDRDRIVNQVAGSLIQSGQCPVAATGTAAAAPPPPASAPRAAPVGPLPPPVVPKVQHGDDSAEQGTD